MNVKGHAFLSLMGSKEDSGGCCIPILEFQLPPTQNGIEAAKTIENALKAWREQIKGD